MPQALFMCVGRPASTPRHVSASSGGELFFRYYFVSSRRDRISVPGSKRLSSLLFLVKFFAVA